MTIYSIVSFLTSMRTYYIVSVTHGKYYYLCEIVHATPCNLFTSSCIIIMPSSSLHLLLTSYIISSPPPFFSLPVGESLTPYSGLNILRAVDISPSSSLSPAGLAGLMKVTLSIGSHHLPNSQKVESKCSESGDMIRSLEQRYCILLDGVLTFLPPTAVSGCCNTRAVGSMENRSTCLSGYVTKQVNDLTVSLKGSKGECTTFLLECTSGLDRFKWHTALAAHIEHVDSKAASKWLF